MNTPRLLAVMIACAVASAPLQIENVAAQSLAEMRRSVEAAMVLTGTVDISTTGTVEALHLDHVEKIDLPIRQNLQTLVDGWRFEPVIKDGRAVPARAPLRMRLLARQTEDGGVALSVSSASFDTYDGEDEESVRSRKMTPPKFPDVALDRGASGEVTLIVEVGRDGRAKNVAVEQVNMRVLLREKEMNRVRDALAKVSLRAAERWEFAAPTRGEYADDASWTVRVPVNFGYGNEVEKYGKWQAYIPGPKFPAAWQYRGKGTADDDGGLLAEGGVYMAGASKGPRLLTPLGG